MNDDEIIKNFKKRIGITQKEELAENLETDDEIKSMLSDARADSLDKAIEELENYKNLKADRVLKGNQNILVCTWLEGAISALRALKEKEGQA